MKATVIYQIYFEHLNRTNVIVSWNNEKHLIVGRFELDPVGQEAGTLPLVCQESIKERVN